MKEAETRAEQIDRALKAAGCGVIERSRVRRDKALTADYVLEYRHTKLATLEALKKSLLHHAFSGEL